MRIVVLLLLTFAACTRSPSGSPGSGDLSAELADTVSSLLEEPTRMDAGDVDAIAALGASGDLRVGWVLVDLLRFHQGQTAGPAMAAALSELSGGSDDPYEGSWIRFSDLLLTQDVDAPNGYLAWKAKIYTAFHEGFAPFFDPASPLDWRTVTWGGVLRDGISPLDDPVVTDAEEGGWLSGDEEVFGVVVGDESRAYPRRILEVHEVVNDEIAGRKIGITYCTLCGAPIAYFLDGAGGTEFSLSTTGLLRRSNKLMYDRNTESVFEQFSGRAVTGPLLTQGAELERADMSVVSWGEWKRGHPSTTVLAAEIGGRRYLEDPLGGRDDDGPIFPVGEIDDRLDANERVFGVLGPRGQAVAFVADRALAELDAGRPVELAGVRLESRDGAVVATVDDLEVVEITAFWFAWSQFHPGTLLWPAS